jgi:LDH2 family malate/lactate/ureidoglycolate dehydrogenase
MSEFRRLKEKFESCYLNGFFLDRNTFLKADDAELVMAWRKDDDGRPTQKPMVVLKKAVEMIVDHRGKIVAIECKEKLGVWVDAFEHAVESFNKET